METSYFIKSSHRLYKKAALKNFAVFKRKTTVLKSLFHKVSALQPCNFIKNRLQHRCFLVAKFLRTSTLKNIQRLLLNWLYEVIDWNFALDCHFQNHPESVILQKYHLPSNQSFKRNSAHILSLYLTRTLLTVATQKANACSPWTPCYLFSS